VTPAAVGGGTDLFALTLGQKLSEVWGQKVLIDNKPGEGDNIGGETVMQANPDGQTLLAIPGTIATNVAAYRKLPYDLTQDFQAVTLFGQTRSFLLVHPSVKANTVKEFDQCADFHGVGLPRKGFGSLACRVGACQLSTGRFAKVACGFYQGE